MKRKFQIALLTSSCLMLTAATSFAEDIDKIAQANAGRFGIWTILPPLLAIVLAFITRNVVISLFLGLFSGSFMLAILETNPLKAIVFAFLDLVQRSLNSLADPWNAGIVLQVLIIGGVINLVAKMGGAKAIAEALASKAKTSKGALFITWLLGLLVFFDDYANSLIVGPIMRPVADKMKISREKLAFIIDATAAPIAGIAIISTWIGLEVGLINDAFKSIHVDVDAFGVFLNTIPYRFYNIFILLFIVVLIVLARDFGSMRKAEYNTFHKSDNQTEEEIRLAEELDDLAPMEGVELSIWNAIIPIGTLIISALVAFYYSGYSSIMGGDNKELINLLNSHPFGLMAIKECFSASDASTALFQSALFASIVAIAMAYFKKIFTVSQSIEIWIDGMKTLVITGVILILAWSLSSVIKEVGTAKFMIKYLSNTLPPFLLPSLIFVLGAIISFSTGTAYGTMGILMPLAIPLAHSINPDMSYIVVATSAVLTGAIFGDHCSPISDTTILSSMGAGCNHIDHVKTQMPYALFIAGITIVFGYIPAGIGLPSYIILPIGVVAITIITRFIGKKVEEPIQTK